MSYNPYRFGFAPATDRQIIGGSAPYVYNYLPHDNQICITAKTLYNNAHESVYNPDSIVRSHPSSSIIQGWNMNIHEKTIQSTCKPSSK